MKLTKTQLREIIREELQSLTEQSISEDVLQKIIKASDIMKWKIKNAKGSEPEKLNGTPVVDSVEVKPKTSLILVTYHRNIKYAYSMGEVKMMIKQTAPELKLSTTIGGVKYKAKFIRMKDKLTAMYKITQE